MEKGALMKAERIAELRLLADSDSSVTLNSKELIWLLDSHYELKSALRGLLETHDAIDPPEKDPCPECLAATVVLDKVGASVG
jgi:hypothetical protein